MKWSEAKKIIESNPEVAKELKANEKEYELIRQFIRARIDKNLTQAELADTKQSSIARFESGNCNPSFMFLQKLADALNCKINISLTAN